MSILRKEEVKKEGPNILRLKKDRVHGPDGIFSTKFSTEQASILYPLVTDKSPEEVQVHLDAGALGPLQSSAEAKTHEKRMAIYQEVIETSVLPEKSFEQVIEELESLREDNPFMKAYVSPAVIEALKQSDNVIARRMAQTRLNNVLIAAEVLNNKLSETSTGFWNGVGDFLDVAASDLPIVSAMNVSRREELSNKFVQLLDSSEDPALVKAALEEIVNEAADMGFFTDQNRFYFGDFLDLTLEQGKGNALTTQKAFAVVDIVASIGGAVTSLREVGKLVALTRGNSKEAAAVLMEGIAKDDIAGAVDPSTWRESLLTPERIEPRSPIEAAAAHDANAELSARKIATEAKIAAGEALDDDAFAVFSAPIIEKAKKDLEKSGGKRVIDVTTGRDLMDNAYLYEFYGTTKGLAFTNKRAAEIYATQIAGEVVPINPRINVEPPLADGFVRFYHHGPIGGKNTYSTNKEYSKQYLGDSTELYYFDVPKTDDAVEPLAINSFKTSMTTSSLDPNVFGGPKRIDLSDTASSWMVRKTKNLPTGWFSQGVSANDIVNDLAAYTSIDGDELGTGFFANFGSPLSQTDWTNNALLKRGESARALAISKFVPMVERSLKAVDKEGQLAVDKVLEELRDGSLAHLRDNPSIGEFEEIFFKLNHRQPTEAEKTLYEQINEWNDTDWILSADMHFKREVNKGTEILMPQDGIEVPATKTIASEGRLVWDVDAGKYVKSEDLPSDRVTYRLHTPMEFDGKLTDLVASTTPKTRALKHTDVYGYNAGGSRLYEPNKSNFFIKQRTYFTLADGTVREGMPRALMAAKTEKEALKAEREINTILKGLHTLVNPSAFTKASDYLEVIKTKYKDSKLNELIAVNSGWNTDVHSVETLVEWASENNFDLRELVGKVGDGESLVDGDSVIGDLTFKDVASSLGRLKFSDFRKDNVLIGYGGKKLPTVSPIQSIATSLVSSTARMTNTAYESRAIMRLYRTALENKLVPKESIAYIRNMSLRQKLRNMTIYTSTDLGKKLELERKKILTRIESQKWIDDRYHRLREKFSNYLYDMGFKGASNKIDGMSADPNAAIRGIVFDRFFWGAIDQVYVQGSQIFSIAAMADKTLGVQAATLAPLFRGALINGHQPVMAKMTEALGGFLGIKPQHIMDMLDTWRASGKGAVQASLADLGEDSAGKMHLRKVRNAGRIFFTEGEMISRITAHIAASMEYLAKNGPEASLKSQHATRWVTHESDKLTHAMTSTSRHALEHLPMAQFMSYTMRMTEYLLGGTLGGKAVLTTKQKARLATMQLGLFGVGSVPFVGAYLSWYEWKYGTGLDEDTYNLIRKGMLDGIIEYVTGVETALGSRLSWGEGLWNTMTDLQDKSLWQIISGPAGQTATDVWTATSLLVGNIKYGSSQMSVDDLIDVAKLMKFSSMYHNAYIAFRDGIFRMKNSGQEILSDVSFGEAMAIALGVPLERVNSVWDNIENQKMDTEYYKELGKKISRMFQDLAVEAEKNGYESEYSKQLLQAISHLYAINPDVDKYDRFVNKDSISMYEQMLINKAIQDARKNLTGVNN